MIRENGFYWVLTIEWEVAQWRNEEWHMIDIERPQPDDYFNYIVETRINEPEMILKDIK